MNNLLGKRGHQGEDIQALFLDAPVYIDVRVLAANTAEVFTLPSGAKYAVFSSTGDFFARPDAAASVPTTDVTDGTGSFLSPSQWHVEGLTTIGLEAAAICIVTIAIYNN